MERFEAKGVKRLAPIWTQSGGALRQGDGTKSVEGARSFAASSGSLAANQRLRRAIE